MTNEDILFAPLDTPPAYAAVVGRLQRAIALGILLPGDRLPSERKLSEQLGVSRVTVREALRVLQGEGVLVTKRGSGGTVVSAAVGSATQVSQEFEAEVGEVFEFRVAVESMAARLAAERGTPGDIGALAQCQTSLAASTNVDTFRRADSDFHLTIARMSANSMLQRSIEDARAAAFAWLDLREFHVFHDSSIKGHAAIIEAIQRQDCDSAAEAMVQHIQQARGEVLTALAAAIQL